MLLLAGGLAAPAKASEDVLDGLGFERTLGDRQLLRTWHRQKALTHAPAKIPTHGRRVAPRNRRITEQPEPLAAPASIGPVSVATAARRDRYAPIIDAEAARQGVDPNLVHAVIRAESAYRPSAKSHAGAYGLMQLMPATAKRFGVRDIWDPAQNIRGGVAYLRFLVDRFDGDIHLVLAAYNAGEGAVEKHGNRIPPYRETRAYVRRVLEYLGAA
ncbi:MAG: lytic transglycosylase domain-containing protein [Thiohalocapsa sp.]|nr:lytic transglycosylase domain-containing protein [Thiohalocapsa sp.]MCF7989193.1 lytic transglycosylase domain-containing protein [Thiohalocapsa sp.]